jgi:tRNA nucleotidyltransferase/poly(A) polymerase
MVAAGDHDGSVELPGTQESALVLSPSAYRGRHGRAAPAPDPIEILRVNRTNQLLSDTFSTGPHQLYLVGGSVRDTLAGKTSFDDLDYTTDASPDTIEEMVDSLGPVWTAGKRFGTIGVTPRGHGQKVEVTTFRAEQYDDDSRKPTVKFGDSIEDDLARRDFTINAMAVAMVDGGGYAAGDLVDPFGGLEDLHAGVLRTPGDPHVTMSEDPLRVDRAFRFAATWNLEIDPSLAEAITATSPRLEVVSAERRTEELRKILTKGGPVLSKVMELTAELEVVHPLTSTLRNDTLTRKVVAQLSGPDALAALVHLSGSAGPKALSNMVMAGAEQKRALQIAELVTTLSSPPSTRTAREVIRNNDDEHIEAAQQILGALNVPLSNNLATSVTAEMGAAAQIRAPLPINGDSLIAAGVKPGPHFGKALDAVLSAFLDEPALTQQAALEIALTQLQ